MHLIRTFFLTCFLAVKTSAFQSREAPPRLLSNRPKSTIAADAIHEDPVKAKAGNCPFSAAVQELESHGKTSAAAACFLAVQNGSFDPPMATTVIAGALGTYALGAYFEELKTFDGPLLRNIPALVGDVCTEGLVNVLERLSEKYGGKVFSCGPVTIISKNPENIKNALHNTKISATTLPGLPRDAGLCSDKPQVLATCRKAFMSAGAKKEGSGRILSNVAADARQIMIQATSDHGDTLRFQETIATPMAMATSREFVFGSSSLSDDEARTHKTGMETQNLGFEISKLFGAEGIVKTLVQPWRAFSATRKFINNLDSEISSALAQSGCPLGKLRESVSAGKIKQTDAISTAGAFTYFGVDTISIVTDMIIRVLAHPDNAELQSECRTEVDRVLSGRKKVISSMDHIRECNLLKATIAEVLRCHEMGEAGLALPPRIAVRDFDIGGRTVTKGSVVMVTTMDNMGVSVATGNKAWVSSPSIFDPKAWLNEDKTFNERLFGEFTFFGVGAHKCPARQLGFDTVLSVIATTLSHFDHIALKDRDGVSAEKSIVDMELVANVRDR